MKEVSTNEERVEFLTETYDLSANCAKALILAELGFSASGLSKKLGVTEATGRGYLNELEEKIGPDVTQTVPKPVRYATFPGDTVSEPEYSADFGDMSDKMKDKDLPVNKGMKIQEIDKELITING